MRRLHSVVSPASMWMTASLFALCCRFPLQQVLIRAKGRSACRRRMGLGASSLRRLMAIPRGHWARWVARPSVKQVQASSERERGCLPRCGLAALAFLMFSLRAAICASLRMRAHFGLGSEPFWDASWGMITPNTPLLLKAALKKCAYNDIALL